MADIQTARSLSQEKALLDQVIRLERFKTGRLAVQIHFSLLTPGNRRRDYLRIATETFSTAVKALEGGLFTLCNDDVVFIAKDASNAALENVASRIRTLFKSDPLVQYGDESKGTGLFTWFPLEVTYQAFLEIAQTYLRTAEQARMGPVLDTPPESDALAPVQPELLAKLEQALGRVDVSNIVRRQTVCTLFDGRPPQTLFDEMFVSIAELQEIATPGVDLHANPWLFQYLTRALDRRMLLKLIRDGLKSERPFSLNLNISTILSPEFFRFQEVVPPQLRGRLIVEINKVDVFADMTTFFFARDYLHDNGFRLCLDGLTPHTLAYYDRARLGFDMIKLYWTPDSVDVMPPDMMPSVRNVIMDAGQARTILCRCDSEKALEVGQQLGIVMFQGRHVEKLIESGKPVQMPAPRA